MGGPFRLTCNHEEFANVEGESMLEEVMPRACSEAVVFFVLHRRDVAIRSEGLIAGHSDADESGRHGLPG